MFVPGVNGSIIANSNAPSGSRLKGAYKNSKKRKMPNGRSMPNTYNTQLNRNEERDFTLWHDKNYPGQKIEDSIRDYDLRGAYREIQNGTVQFDERHHLPDKYKKPNHITFSKESVYASKQNPGGNWYQSEGKSTDEDKKAWHFKPSAQTVALHGADRLQEYFKTNEPESKLIINKVGREMANGGTLPPRYTSNPNDPRLKAYQDSLYVRRSNPQTFTPGNRTRPLTPDEKIFWKDEKTGLVPNLVEYNPDRPTSGYFGHYKKPVQPYIYKKPEVSPIYTSDINDPRLGSYNDSLNLYKSAKNDFNKFNKLSNNFDRDLNDEEWQRNSDRYDKLLNLQKNKWHTADRPNYTANYPYKGPKSGLTIQPVGLEGFYREGYHFPRFKKPVQPYIYKPEVVSEVTETPLPVAPIEQPVKKIGYNKPIIQQFNYMSNENKTKALKKYGSVSDIPFKGVDINQLKKGGEVEDDDDKEMVDGVASILRRVKDPKNRLQLANQLSKQFNRENVKYDLPSFLNKSKVKK